MAQLTVTLTQGTESAGFVIPTEVVEAVFDPGFTVERGRDNLREFFKSWVRNEALKRHQDTEVQPWLDLIVNVD